MTAIVPWAGPYLDHALAMFGEEAEPLTCHTGITLRQFNYRFRETPTGYSPENSWWSGSTGRRALAKLYAWGVPNLEAVEAIRELGMPVVEVGAGSGFWAMILAAAGVDVVAYDNDSWTMHDYRWFPVRRGNERHVTLHHDRALLLCWPPYDDPMAYECAKRAGDVLVYVGEGYGGCTGDDDFHAYLESHWEQVQHVAIPQWDGLHDRLYIYKRARPRALPAGRLPD